MNLCALVLGIVIGCASGDAPRQDRVDRWLAEDKARHFTMSFAVTAMGYGAARTAMGHDAAAATAVGAAAAAGLGKELVDARSGRWFSPKDLVWDAAGVALGYLLVDRIR